MSSGNNEVSLAVPARGVDPRVTRPPIMHAGPAAPVDVRPSARTVWRRMTLCGYRRGFFFRVGTVSRAQGSCYAELGSTKVMVGVYGPRQTHRSQGYSDQGSLFCDVKFANFATRQRTESGQSPEVRGSSCNAPLFHGKRHPSHDSR